MTHAGQALLALAVEQFSKLTDAEEKFLCKIAAGEVADYRTSNDTENDPTQAETWDPSRTIRATVIRWLCIDRDAIRYIDPQGIHIGAAKIEGQLDLAYATVPAPLGFWKCAFPDGVNLVQASTYTLMFNGSFIRGSGDIALWSDGIHVNGNMFLRDGFRARGAVRLVGATLTGDLTCNGGTFYNPNHDALRADGARVSGNVHLHSGFHAEGEVSLVGATITGALACDGGAFHNPRGDALSADGLQVGRGAFFREPFQAEGKIRLQRAMIALTLDCDGGIFLNEKETALDFEGGHVNGTVFLRYGFHARGEVRLHSSTIAGDLDCQGGAFHNAGGRALTAEISTIGGRVLLRRGFQAEGEVRLLGARITGELDCHRGLFYNPKRFALVADRARMDGGVFLSEGFGAAGEVRLVGASITGDLHCCGGTFHNPGGRALTADRVNVSGVARLGQGFRAEGMVHLEGAKVAQLDDDEASWPSDEMLRLDGFVYSTIGSDFDDPIKPIDAKARLRWLKRQPSPSFRPQPYLQLAKVLRERGDEEGAKQVLIAKEWARWKQDWARWKYKNLIRASWWWSLLLRVTISYGYKPGQALICACILVVLGWIFFGMGYQKEIVIPTKAEAYYADKNTKQETAFYPAFRPLLYSLDTFVPIINFGQKDYWGPQVACNRSWLKGGSIIRLCIRETRVLYVYRWVHTAFGWGLITLFITGFTNLVRKE